MRKRAPPRLWLRKAQRDGAGRISHAAVWIIKDGKHRESTGCTEHDLGGAGDALTAYLNEKHTAAADSGERPPAAIPVADVLNRYVRDKVKPEATEARRRIKALAAFFGGDTLADIDGDRCRAYVAHRGSEASGRRELEDLRAAINHHRREGLCSAIVEVVLPPRGDSRDRWLTRKEAATLIKTAWRYREVQKGHPTGRPSRQHVARFLVAALYSCRRKSALLTAHLGPITGHPWIDLDRGIFYGRPSARRSKKRQPAIVVPPRLLGHLRRWHKNGQQWVIEFNGEPIASIDKAYAANVDAAKLGADVVVHTTRHTGITWLAIEGRDPYEICRYAGITMEVFEEVYAHHHPDFMSGVKEGFRGERMKKAAAPFRHRLPATEREQTPSNVTAIADYSRASG